MQVVHRHREAAVGGAGEPLARDGVDVRPLGLRQLIGSGDPKGEAGALEPGDRLAHLADAATLEREPGGIEHRLVAASKRAQPAGAVEVEPAAGCVQDDESPAALAADGAEVVYEAGYVVRGADGIARHERAAGHDAVGQEGVPGPREHVPAVAAEREEREAVVSVIGDESARARS